MRLLLFWVTLLAASTACSRNAEETPATAADNTSVLLTSSFEELDGWTGDTPSLTTEKAYTGQYAIKIDPAVEYSLTYRKQLARLSPARVAKMRLTAWSFRTQKDEPAALVFQITSPDPAVGNIFYDKIDITEAGAWTQVSRVFTLPPVIDPASEIHIYLWRDKASSAVYLDDISLAVEP